MCREKVSLLVLVSLEILINRPKRWRTGSLCIKKTNVENHSLRNTNCICPYENENVAYLIKPNEHLIRSAPYI